MFCQGLIELILSLILMSILIKNDIIFDYSYYWEQIKAVGIYKIILLIFFYFCTFSQTFIIIDILSPFYIFIVYLIVYIIWSVYELLSTDFNYTFFVFLFLASICLFFVLVFIEIIELNCFGLSYMTKKNITIRGQRDMKLNKADVNEGDLQSENENEVIYDDYIIKLENRNTMKELDYMNNET